MTDELEKKQRIAEQARQAALEAQMKKKKRKDDLAQNRVSLVDLT